MTKRTTRLQREREDRGLSRADLARRILDALEPDDLQRPTIPDMATNIRRWETGKVEAVSLRYQRASAIALGIPRPELFELTQSDPTGETHSAGQAVTGFGVPQVDAGAEGPNPPAYCQAGTVVTVRDEPTIEDDVNRRAVLRLLGAVGAGTAVPAEDLRTVFSGIENAVADHVDVDDWERAVADYVYMQTTDPGTLIKDLTTDVIAVGQVLKHRHPPAMQAGLLRVAAGLAGLLATEFTQVGDYRAASTSWRSALRAADASGDRELRVWVRAKQADDLRWSGRPLRIIGGLVDEAVMIAGGVASFGLFRAQTVQASIAVARTDVAAAQEATEAFTRTFENLPDSGRAPDVAWNLMETGLGPAFLRWHQADLRTQIDAPNAGDTIDQALTLYPIELANGRSSLELMRAVKMVRDRDVSGGMDHAAKIVQDEPMSTVRRQLLGQMLNSLPRQAQALPEAQNLRAVLAGSSQGR